MRTLPAFDFGFDFDFAFDFAAFARASAVADTTTAVIRACAPTEDNKIL